MLRPPPRKPVSQAQLNLFFDEGGWQERIRHCHCEEKRHLTSRLSIFPPGTVCVRKKYYDGATLIAIVILYLTIDGVPSTMTSGKPIPKGLLIDGLWHFVEA